MEPSTPRERFYDWLRLRKHVLPRVGVTVVVHRGQKSGGLSLSRRGDRRSLLAIDDRIELQNAVTR